MSGINRSPLWAASCRGTRLSPFAFRLHEGESSRTVDGRLRLQLAGQLLTSLGGQSDGPSRKAARLVKLAEIATLLPNDRDNLGGRPAQLEAAHLIRQQLYQALQQELGVAGDLPVRTMILRQMMLLNAANREAQAPEPPFDSVVKALATSKSLGEGLSKVLVEEVEVRMVLSSKPAGGPDAARVRFDDRLKALHPEGWDRGVTGLEKLDFLRKLRDLDGKRITDLLFLRDDLRAILAARDDGPALGRDLCADRVCTQPARSVRVVSTS